MLNKLFQMVFKIKSIFVSYVFFYPVIICFIFQHMVQTGMTTPYTAFAQQNGGPAGDTSAMKPDMKAVDGGPPGGGGGGGSPNATQQALQALHQSAQHANGVVDQQQNATV